MERVYVDMECSRIGAIVPVTEWLMEGAMTRSQSPAVMLLSEDEAESLELVETGESRTPRPKDPLAEYATSLSGA